MKAGLCMNCDDRGNCVKLCEEAEAYVSQDYVQLSETLMSQLDFDIEEVPSTEIAWGSVELLNERDWEVLMEIAGDVLTDKQKKMLYQHLWIGISCRKLGKIYGVSGQSVSGLIRRAKDRIKERMI